LGKWIRKNLLTIIMAMGMLAGIGLLAYPSVANYWNQFHQSRAIMDYNEDVAALTEADYKRILDSARKYNDRMAKTGMRWHMTPAQKKEYEKELDINGTGIMGYISVPKIRVKAPLYHGTEESVLQIAIGHLECSSLPVDCKSKSYHILVSGHRGLPSARLFTDIVTLKEGDTWTMTVLNETLTFQCDQIRKVLPDDLSNLQIEKGKEYCTLITCTPYGINTHRMLIRGHRIPNADGAANLIADAIQIEPIYIVPFLSVLILLILVILLWVSARRAKRYDTDNIRQLYLDEKGLDYDEEF
jgi:sortase A